MENTDGVHVTKDINMNIQHDGQVEGSRTVGHKVKKKKSEVSKKSARNSNKNTFRKVEEYFNGGKRKRDSGDNNSEVRISKRLTRASVAKQVENDDKGDEEEEGITNDVDTNVYEGLKLLIIISCIISVDTSPPFAVDVILMQWAELRQQFKQDDNVILRPIPSDLNDDDRITLELHNWDTCDRLLSKNDKVTKIQILCHHAVLFLIYQEIQSAVRNGLTP
jgi:hypothetical protein